MLFELTGGPVKDMELWHYFAAHAAPMPDNSDKGNLNMLERRVKWAWSYADAMLEEMNKR